jgi:hypothetical protein
VTPDWTFTSMGAFADAVDAEVAPAAVRTCRRRVVRAGSACPRRAVFSCSA